jgi:hypothetical protein
MNLPTVKVSPVLAAIGAKAAAPIVEKARRDYALAKLRADYAFGEMTAKQRRAKAIEILRGVESATTVRNLSRAIASGEAALERNKKAKEAKEAKPKPAPAPAPAKKQRKISALAEKVDEQIREDIIDRIELMESGNDDEDRNTRAQLEEYMDESFVDSFDQYIVRHNTNAQEYIDYLVRKLESSSIDRKDILKALNELNETDNSLYDYGDYFDEILEDVKEEVEAAKSVESALHYLLEQDGWDPEGDETDYEHIGDDLDYWVRQTVYFLKENGWKPKEIAESAMDLDEGFLMFDDYIEEHGAKALVKKYKEERGRE